MAAGFNVFNKEIPGLAKSDFLLAQLSIAEAQLFSQPGRKRAVHGDERKAGTGRGTALKKKLSMLFKKKLSMRTTPQTSEGQTDTKGEFGKEETEMVADGAPACPWPAQRGGLGWEGCGGEQGSRCSHSPAARHPPQHSMQRTTAALGCHTHIPVKLLEPGLGRHT